MYKYKNAIGHPIRLHDGKTLLITKDEYSVNPRKDMDTFSTIVAWHNDYIVGDKHKYRTPKDFLDEWEGKAYIYDLFMYQHGMAYLSMEPFNDVWGNAQVGYIYVPKSKAESEHLSEEQVYEIVKSELSIYNDWFTGNVYGYVLEDEDWNCVDSCWGFIGDIEKSGLLDSIPEEYREEVSSALLVQ